MHQSVLDAFVRFSSPIEGVTTTLYLDVKGLVTCGIGCLADPVSLALPLPWVMPDGTPASRNEIAAQWRALKDQPALKNYPALSKQVLAATTIRLTDSGVLELASQRLLANEKILRQYFPNWDSWPADAQLCACSMAWAVGAGFPQTFGNFRAAANAHDWLGAQAACAIRTDGNPGLVPRNAQNRLCLANAAAVVAQGLPVETLFWPGTAPNAGDRDEALRQEAAAALALHTDFQGNVLDAEGNVIAADPESTS